MPPFLRAGVARVEITPPPGLDLTGFIARENPSTGLRDPLYARALVLDDERRQIALVSCDLLGFASELVADIRARVAVATGIPGPQVMLTATHTHAGPATLFLQDCGAPDPGYLQQLEEQVATAVRLAQTRLRPATLNLGWGAATDGVHNRRVPGGVVDPAVGVLRIEEANSSGAALAVVVNFACHPTCLHTDNRRISADYPGAVTAAVEAATGAVCLFLTGAIGDIGPEGRGEASLTRIGRAVAEEVQRVLPETTALDAPWLDTEGEILELPFATLPTRPQLLAAREDLGSAVLVHEGSNRPVEARMARAMVGWTERILEQIKAGALPPTTPAEIHILHLGAMVIVGVPGELFAELGLAIQAQLAPHPVFVCGFANGDIGYIPTRAAYSQGGYEIEEAYRYYGYPAALAPEAGEQLVAAVVEQVRRKYAT
jgi:hypothetical protein